MAQRQKKVKERVKDSKPSLPLAAYSGSYSNDMLGTAKVTQKDSGLQISFNDFITYQAEHWHYDTFKTNKDQRFRSKMEIRFELDNDGKVNQFDFLGTIFKKNQLVKLK